MLLKGFKKKRYDSTLLDECAFQKDFEFSQNTNVQCIRFEIARGYEVKSTKKALIADY